MAQWVALKPLFEVFAVEKVYAGSGRRRETWWLHETTETQLQDTLEGISREDKRRSRLEESVMKQEPEGGGVAG